MLALLKQYFDIAFLMGKPQDLPSGETQMVMAIVLNFITYVLALIGFTGVGAAAVHAVIDIGCSALFIYFALKLTSQLSRFNQALGAICGAGAVLNIAAIPMLQLTQAPVDEAGMSIAFLTRFLLLVWGLSLVAHIIRHTFNIQMFASIGIALIYYLFMISLLAMVFPPDPALDDAISMRVDPEYQMVTKQFPPPVHGGLVSA